MSINVCQNYIDSIVRRLQLYKSIDKIKSKKESFVIMFHDVSFSNTNGDKYGININDFDKTINYIQKLEYQFVHFEDFSKKEKNKFGYCILTFDDGFYSTYRLMKEYLIKKDIPFHVFITTDWIGKEGYIATAQLIEMAEESICRIGSHSCSHPLFRNLKMDDANEEFYNSKVRIEELIKKEIRDFAFPYGSKYACSRKNFAQALDAGYINIYSTDPFTLKKLNSSHRIPRINGVEIFKTIS